MGARETSVCRSTRHTALKLWCSSVSTPTRFARVIRRVVAAFAAAAATLSLITPLSHADTSPASVASTPLSAVATSDGDPIQVHIERVTPSALGSAPTLPDPPEPDTDPDTAPTVETITVTGTVVNVSDNVWTDIHVYPLTSYQPITSATALSRALDSSEDAYIGSRLLDLRDEVPGQLEPGASASFSLALPRDQLRISGRAGVYWLGLHVLGTEEGVREIGIDGRARILLPLAEPATQTTAALVVPVRDRVTLDASGALAEPEAWERLLDPSGRLGRVLGLAATAPEVPLSWTIDPAVVDAATRLSAGNPGLELVPSTPSTPRGPGAEWLDQLRSAISGDAVFALPYGDIDDAAVLRAGRASMLTRAIQQGESALDEAGLAAQPILAPLSGRLTWATLDALGSASALLSRSAVRDGSPLRLATERGAPVVTSVQASTSGDALQTRQEILALALIHATSGSDDPLVVQLPETWDPGSAWATSDFFAGLAVPWLTQTNLTAVLALPATRVVSEADNDLREPSTRDELPSEVVVQANRLIQTGRTLGDLVAERNSVTDSTTRWALLGTSIHSRTDPTAVLHWLSSRHREIARHLAQVRIEAPTFVTMSSEQGPFQVTVENGLPVTVRVSVEARALGGQLEVEEPEPVEVGAEQQHSIRLLASARGLGEYRLQLRPMTTEGDAFGTAAELRIRSSRVGQFIWAGLGVGTLVLVGLITIRVRRRMRARKQTPGPLLARLDRAQRDPDSPPPADQPHPEGS